MATSLGQAMKEALDKPVLKLGLLLGFGTLLLLIFVNVFEYPPGWDFRNNLWGPAHLLVNGESAYRVDLLFETSTALWMPPIIGLLFPLGWLSLQQASSLWWGISFAAMIGIIWISSGKTRPQPLRLLTVSLLAFLFPSVISHFDLGQVSILITLLYLIAATYQERLNPIVLVVLLVIALSKPQLGLYVIPGFIFCYYKERGRSALLMLLGLMALVAVVLSLPLFIASPEWLVDLVDNLQGNPNWGHASLQIWFSTQLGSAGLVLWGVILLIGMVLNLWIWHTRPKREAVVRSLAITALLTPYIWSWDFVLVIPLLVEFAFRDHSRRVLALFGVGYLACLIVFIGLRLTANLPEADYWWVSWVLVGLVMLGELFAGRSKRPVTSAAS